jgi:outer membrane protein
VPLPTAIRTSLPATLLLFLFLTSAASSAFGAYSLNESFQASLLRSLDIANQNELLTQAEEKVSQAWGSVLPNINGTFTRLIQAKPSSPSGASFFPEAQSTFKVTGTQPLFQGFREFMALKQTKKSAAAAEQSLNYAKQLLFQDVSQSFYQVLAAEADLRNLRNEIDQNNKRLKEVAHFRKIGRAREVEVLTLQSNIAALEAQTAAVEGSLNNARTLFSILTGLPSNTDVVDDEKLPEQIPTLEDYLGRIPLRPDVLAQQSTVESGEAGVNFAKGAHLPAVNFIANYYFQRPGALSDVNWDIQLGVTMPLFQGGVIQSQVRTAASVSAQNEIALSKIRLTARQQIESAYYSYLSDQSQLNRQTSAVDLSAKNYNAEQIDYRRGLVTNIEVLSSLAAYQENRRTLDRVRFLLKSDFLKLQAAAAYRPNIAAVK